MPIKLTTPISEEEIRKLKVGDEVLLSGTIVTARDQAHKLMVEEKPDFIREYLKDSVIYHCGPVVKKNDDGSWSFVAAGPTTSSREEPYQADVICEYQVRGVIGKGGMGPKTAEGLKKCGAVYFHAVGGAGSLIAKRVKKVKTVFKLEEFGTPEAFWVIEVEDFPVVVTMDAHGNSLHKQILEKSEAKAKELMGL
ncbi:fumarate hydratase, class I, beta subunit [Deferribacter desulfuricans SSM1]|uniref:Fumarate hydratase, class I, beta subunit n=1 Tax=Deferribacter desulfuricans (strain DSM 14783 / JCM 11476 / NBRC 101012 / SSM1) TaxID=639282 RepID=D3PCR4_DEFDS|nr:FumA C-terminus/TtdB family hydratase beta subunit [Deferribacter desulfuricans]BAI80387.1 fumarate hydratase, class I, beta subunit [Deferribacter desulfuricans SSM1]